MFSNPFFSFVIKWIYMGIHHVEQYNDTRWLPTQLQISTYMCTRVYGARGAGYMGMRTPLQCEIESGAHFL
jgi:hypothetical protein